MNFGIEFSHMSSKPQITYIYILDKYGDFQHYFEYGKGHNIL